MKNIFLVFVLTLSVAFINADVIAAPKNISKQQAVNIAKERHPGRVLGVKRKENVYRVKTLSKKGKVRVTNIDAESGKIKSHKKSNKKFKR